MQLQCSICQTRQEWKLNSAELTSIKDLGATLIPCQACHKKTYHVYPSHGEYVPGRDRRHFGSHSGITVPPAFSRPEAASTPAPTIAFPPALSPKPKAAGDDRGGENRGPRRVRLELPLRVRNMDYGFEEVTTTVNVSRGGVYFMTERSYRIGQPVRIQLNYNSSGGDALEQPGEVARVQNVAGSFKKGVALKYL
jgi:hypothetical protein